jgi:hypothetical protein
MSSVRKHGKTIHSKVRELADNVIKASDKEANQKELFSPLARATENVFKCIGLSTATINRTRKESKNRSDTGLSLTLYTSGKHRPRPNERNVKVNHFDMAVKMCMTFMSQMVCRVAQNCCP